jgi:hypothetical protein
MAIPIRLEMNPMNIKKILQCGAVTLGLSWWSLQPISSIAGDSDGEDAGSRHIQGIAVTGVNSIVGKPFFSWGAPFGASFNVPTMGAYNKDGPDPTPLDANTPKSALLASWIDPLFLSLFNKPPGYVVNPAWLNVPLRKVPINVDFALAKRVPLPGVRDVGPIDLAQVEPTNDITLGQWLGASGVATIRCAGEGATIELRMRRLIPNRMYSVWGTMGLPAQPGAQAPGAFPIPLGGTPNIFVTDKNGDGTFERWVKFCPFVPQSSGSPLLFIDVQFNAIDQTWGAVVAPGFIDGNWPGFITFSHVVFPVNVELLNE